MRKGIPFFSSRPALKHLELRDSKLLTDTASVVRGYANISNLEIMQNVNLGTHLALHAISYLLKE